AQEAFERLAVVDHLLGNELEGDMTGEARVFRLVHHAHAATAELSHDVIVGDCLADHSRASVPSAAMLGCRRSSGQPSSPTKGCEFLRNCIRGSQETAAETGVAAARSLGRRPKGRCRAESI